MTKETEALTLALDALEHPNMKTRSMLEQRDAAIAAVKEALAQPAPPKLTDSMGMPVSCGKPLCSPDDHHPLCKLAEQPAQPEQDEPVDDLAQNHFCHGAFVHKPTDELCNKCGKE